MDPTFGGQELLESLSQASRQSKDSRNSRSNNSRGSSNSTLTSAHTNPVEDAYRRIGQGLSQRATGGGAEAGGGGSSVRSQGTNNSARIAARIGQHPCTSFQRFRKPSKKPFNPHSSLGGGGGHPHPQLTQGGPSPKIAKLGRFQDVDHTGNGIINSQHRPSQRILKQITMTSKEMFHKLRRQQKAGYLNKYNTQQQPNQQQQHYQYEGGPLSASNTSSGHTSITSAMTMSGGQSLDKQYGRPSEQQLLMQQQQQAYNMSNSYNDPSASPSQRYGFSQVAQQQAGALGSGNQPHLSQQQGGGAGPPPKGLLSAVLEGGSESTYESESVHSLPTINSNKTGVSKASTVRSQQSGPYHQYPGPPGSSLQKHHMSSSSHAAVIEPALHFATPRGRCLTVPGEPVGNDDLDNVEGNMILHQSDILVVPGLTPSTKVRNATNTDIANSSKGLEFHVQSLLGQGTFAQVYCCWESVSKKRVALKIIKNKPAFTKQAAVEIEVFQALSAKKGSKQGGGATVTSEETACVGGSTPSSPHMVHLLSSFMYKSHLCLVFECLGLNLYEVLKRRQFRGLPLGMVRTLARQAMEGVKELAGKSIVHCDLKPENILLAGENVEKEVIGAGENTKQPEPDNMSTSGSVVSLASMSSTGSKQGTSVPQTIKLIDFGSACFEGNSAHTYIQSRFYRSPEVLMGLPYDSAIDIWSLGCVAAELFLGLPILPGVHEHDQCGRIIEMIGEIPDWMLEQGSKASKYYVKYIPRNPNNSNNSHDSKDSGSSGAGTSTTDQMTKPSTGSSYDTPRPMLPQWRLKSQEEYIKSLSQNEIRKKGGLAKLEKQPANRYFKRTKLSDIIMLHGQHCQGEEREMLGAFVHFLYGLLDPDPWKRWTAYQASQHPFITGQPGQLRKKTAETKLDYNEENQANQLFDAYWVAPWDPGICRRKLLNVQKMREKQNTQRRGYSQTRSSASIDGHDSVEMRAASRSNQKSPSMNSLNSRQPMVVADSPSVGHMSVDGKSSPPSQIASQLALHAKNNRAKGGASIASMPQGATASSLSAIGGGNIDLHAALGAELPAKHALYMNTPPNVNNRPYAGPQSYTGLGYESTPGDADFGYALQRPGNVPDFNDAATVASQASMASSHGGGASVSSGQHLLHQQQQQQQYGRMHQNSLPMHSPMYPGGNQAAANVSSLPSAAGYTNKQPARMGGVSYQGGGYGNSLENQGGIQYLAAQQQLQKQMVHGEAGSQQQLPMDAMQHLTPVQQHQLLMQQQMKQQQEQMAAMQRQHELQMAALQQQQQAAFQQQQQQFLAGQHYGGQAGYYYVNAADGTPMLVQQQQPGSMGIIPPGSYDGSATGGGNQYMLPPQHTLQQQRTTSFDDSSNGGSRSVRDNRSRGQMSRAGRQQGGGGNYRGNGGMSM